MILAAAAALQATPVTVTLHPDEAGLKVPTDFIGLSCEKKILSRDCFHPKNTTLLNLCRNLSPAVLRIGGNEVETTFWSRSDARAIESMHKNKYMVDPVTIGPASVEHVFAFAQKSEWRVIYGLNLGTFDPAMAADEADYALKVGGRQLLALEIGNEPNLYPQGPNRPGIRPGSYGYREYKQEFEKTANAIVARNPQAPITGPAITKSTNWMPLFMADFKDRIVLSTSHVYPLSAKETDPAAKRFTSIEKLLGAKFDDDWLPKLQISKAAGIPYRIGECNTASSGGKRGVSDAFASALWLIDFMFDVAKNGGDGINLHGGFNPGNYAPMYFDRKTEAFAPAAIYYGLLFFRHAAQGQLVRTECKTTANVMAHATLASDQRLRVSLINKDLFQPALVRLQTGRQIKKGYVLHLRAPAADATQDITFAGAAVAMDGTWSPKESESLSCEKEEATVTLPPASAALVILE
jgi:hypothetical protein